MLLDVGSHCVDLVDYLAGEIVEVAGFPVNTGGTYQSEDVTAAWFKTARGVVGTGIWNFNASDKRDSMVFTGALGELRTPIFHEDDIVVSTPQGETRFPIRNPPHVHQPLIQTIVDELHGRGRCESTGESGARATRVLDLLPGGRGELRIVSCQLMAKLAEVVHLDDSAGHSQSHNAVRFPLFSTASAMPAATTTFNESTPAAIGMRTLTSAALSASGVRPEPFRAEHQDERPNRDRTRRTNSARGVAPRLGVSARRSGTRGGESTEGLLLASDVSASNGRPVSRHRCPDGLSVERIAARESSSTRPASNVGRDAEQPADVVGVRDGNDWRSTGGRQLTPPSWWLGTWPLRERVAA